MTDASAPPDRGALRRALPAWAAGLACLVVLAAHAPGTVGSLDDVFVVLREARGWLGELGVGDGAGRPAVGGSTSALDLAVRMLGLGLAPAADPLALAGWANLLWWALGALAVAHGAARLGGPAVLCAVGWAGSLGLVESGLYRLEGPLFAAVWAWLLVEAARGRAARVWLPGLLVALARPEGLVLAPAALLWGARSLGPWTLRLALAGSVALLPLGARLWLYGRWAPHSYYAKASDDRLAELADGLRYLDGALTSPAGVALVAVGASCVWACVGAGERPRARARVAGLLSLAGLAALVLVVSGGDGYAGARLALPLGAPVWLAFAAAWSLERRRAVLGAAAVAAAGLQLLGGLPPGSRGIEELTVGTARRLAAGPGGMEAFAGEAEAFRRAAAALGGETLAHRHAQRALWFAPELEVLDLTGLTSAEVAALPAPGPVRFGRDAVEYGLDRRVGALHLDVAVRRPAPLADADLGLLGDPAAATAYLGPPPLAPRLVSRLRQDYVGASLPDPEGRGWFNLLVRADLAERFRAQGFRVGAPGRR